MKTEAIGVREAAQEADAYPQQVYAAIAGGKLKAERLENGQWRISRSSFNEWKRRLQTRRELAVPNRPAEHIAATA
jgi:hypothetical protein